MVHRHVLVMILLRRNVLLFACATLLTLYMSSGSGIRQRLGVADSKPVSTVTGPKAAGGIRNRLLESNSSSSSSAQSKSVREPGIRKRLNLDQRAETNASAPLTKTLKRDWARGQATTPKVLQYARDAKLSGAANLGSLAEETTGKNNFRKMKRAAGPTAIPRTYIEIPKGESGFLYPHPVNDPVDAFCRAIKDDEKKLHRFGADLDQQVPDFWENISGTDLFTAIAANVDVSASLPGWIHGDGAPTNKVDGLFTISWGCTLARGPTATSRFIYTVCKESLITDGTLERLFDHLAFRMNVLVTGKEPERLWNGRKIQKLGRTSIQTAGSLRPFSSRGIGSSLGILYIYLDGTIAITCALTVGQAIRIKNYGGRGLELTGGGLQSGITNNF